MNGTGPEHKPDALGDTLRQAASAKLLKIMEAGTGIEPVFTDLQSAA